MAIIIERNQKIQSLQIIDNIYIHIYIYIYLTIEVQMLKLLKCQKGYIIKE